MLHVQVKVSGTDSLSFFYLMSWTLLPIWPLNRKRWDEFLIWKIRLKKINGEIDNTWIMKDVIKTLKRIHSPRCQTTVDFFKVKYVFGPYNINTIILNQFLLTGSLFCRGCPSLRISLFDWNYSFLYAVSEIKVETNMFESLCCEVQLIFILSCLNLNSSTSLFLNSSKPIWLLSRPFFRYQNTSKLCYICFKIYITFQQRSFRGIEQGKYKDCK